MSYDLFFAVPKGRPPPSDSELQRYFQAHECYELDGNEARYFNQRTGTYFAFEWGRRPLLTDQELDKRGLGPTGISFNLNYARPHSFALEADIELAALVAEFALSVDDPQSQGMGIGEYDAEGFVRGWTAGNKGTLTILTSSIYDRGGSVQELHLLEADDIERHWKWNYLQPALEARGDRYAPQVHYVRMPKGDIRTWVYWPDALRVALPEVEAFVLVDTATDKRVLVPATAFDSVLKGGTWSDDVTRHLRIDDEATLKSVGALLDSGEPLETPLTEVAPDEVLDLEWVREAVMRLRDG